MIVSRLGDEVAPPVGVVTRRRFLAVVGGAVALAGLSACRPPATVAPLLAPAVAPSSPPPPPSSPARAAGPFERSGWTPLLGRVATLDGPAGRMRAEVVEVAAASGATAADQEHRFSVLLRAVDGVAAPSAVHRVAVAGTTPTDLFVSPVDRGARGRWYQIVVSNPS